MDISTLKVGAFIVRMMSGEKHCIDADELPKLIEAKVNGGVCVLRQAIIANPNTISDIVPDWERINEVRRNAANNKYATSPQQKKPETLAPLEDWFFEIRSLIANQMKMLK